MRTHGAEALSPKAGIDIAANTTISDAPPARIEKAPTLRLFNQEALVPSFRTRVGNVLGQMSLKWDKLWGKAPSQSERHLEVVPKLTTEVTSQDVTLARTSESLINDKDALPTTDEGAWPVVNYKRIRPYPHFTPEEFLENRATTDAPESKPVEEVDIPRQPMFSAWETPQEVQAEKPVTQEVSLPWGDGGVRKQTFAEGEVDLSPPDGVLIPGHEELAKEFKAKVPASNVKKNVVEPIVLTPQQRDDRVDLLGRMLKSSFFTQQPESAPEIPEPDAQLPPPVEESHAAHAKKANHKQPTFDWLDRPGQGPLRPMADSSLRIFNETWDSIFSNPEQRFKEALNAVPQKIKSEIDKADALPTVVIVAGYLEKVKEYAEPNVADFKPDVSTPTKALDGIIQAWSTADLAEELATNTLTQDPLMENSAKMVKQGITSPEIFSHLVHSTLAVPSENQPDMAKATTSELYTLYQLSRTIQDATPGMNSEPKIRKAHNEIMTRIVKTYIEDPTAIDPMIESLLEDELRTPRVA